MSSAVELSSTLQMALAGTTISDAVSGAATGFNMMTSGLGRVPTATVGMFAPMVGGTFTNPAMAYTQHWGTQQAETSLQQEWLVDRYGLGAAQRMKPPGVGATEFGLAVEHNFIDRKMEAEHQMFSATRTTIMSGAAGLAGWTVGEKLGGVLGRVVGGRFGVAGLGGIAGGLLGGLAGEAVASDWTSQHYAQIEQQRGIMTELGEISAGGLGYTPAQRFGFGAAALQASRSLGMDVQQMGDIGAGARQMGMLPSSLTSGQATPQQVRADLFNLARSIEEGAAALHTSGAKAMEMVQGMTGTHFGANDGVASLVRMGAASGLGAEGIYNVGMAGASAARQNLMPGRVGFDLFTSSVMSASGAAGREELAMLGGVTGAGQLLAMHQIQAARGPMGTVQSMAGLTGRALSNDLYGLGAQAIEGLNEGGNFLSNYVHFAVNQDRFAAAGGARGVRARAKQQLMTSVRSMRELGISGNDVELGAFALVQEGYNSVQARFVANATMRGGGGGNSSVGEVAVLAMEQDQALNRQAAAAAQAAQPFADVRAALGAVMDIGRDSPWEIMKTTTLAGAGIGLAFSPMGAVIGGLGGLAVGAGIAMFRSSAESGLTPEQAEQVRSASPKDRQAMVEGFLAKNREGRELNKVEEKFGRIPLDSGNPADVQLYNRAVKGDFRHSVLDLDATDAVYAKASATLAEAAGLHGSQTGGGGTMRMAGRYWDIGQLRQTYDDLAKASKHTATSRQAFETVRAGMTASDAQRATQMAEN